ncbi:hypothetical protein EIP86_001307 [Pleurotus ostreatoroseus]|nr:hypothetical protein EIP86_001307 [Pleurotus ostreatoroseus]
MTDTSASQLQPQPTADLTRLLSERYAAVRTQHPGEGRRKWRLRVADAFWAMSPEERAAYASNPPLTQAECAAAAFETDADPLDAHCGNAPGLGVLVRTDFADERAWAAFYEKLQAAEREFAEDVGEDADGDGEEGMAVEDASASGSGSASASMDVDNDENDSSDDESPGASSPTPIIHTLNPPPTSPLRPLLTHISNLTALRLLTDVAVRCAPAPPAGTKRIKPPNRLVEHDGWQEVYVGKTLWVYDARSNADGCVRLVSARGAGYGTATADSWRARVSHLCELQANLASGALTIDFGGMDRWDHAERARNMAEAATPIA